MPTHTRTRESTLSKISKMFVHDSEKNHQPDNPSPLHDTNHMSDPAFTTTGSSSNGSSLNSSTSSLNQQHNDDSRKQQLPQHQHQLHQQQLYSASSSQPPSRVSSIKKMRNTSNDRLPNGTAAAAAAAATPGPSRTSSIKLNTFGSNNNSSAQLHQPPSSSNNSAIPSQLSSTSSGNKNLARFVVFEDGSHQHHLRNAKRQEKLSNMFKNLLINTSGNTKLRDGAVSAIPEILNSAGTGPPSLFSGLLKNQQHGAASGVENYPFSGSTGVPNNCPLASVNGAVNMANFNSVGATNGVESILGPGLGTSNQTFVERYGRCQEVVGKGTFGVVRVSHKKDKDCEKLFAVKEFKKKPEEDSLEYSKRLTSEFCISSSLKHVNIIETVDLLQDAKGDYVEVMEYCSGGDLYTLIIAAGKLEYLEADCFFKQLIRGVNYMHGMGIAHRDLKPENLLLASNGCLKITDFGNGECFRMAWEEKIHLSNGICGSSPYIAPEEYTSKEFDPRLVDIWSCGVIYMAMRTGRHLWKEANNKDDFYKKYLEDRKSSKGYEPIELIKRARCRNVIYSILDPIPSRRINGKQILNSEWGREIKCCVEPKAMI